MLATTRTLLIGSAMLALLCSAEEAGPCASQYGVSPSQEFNSSVWLPTAPVNSNRGVFFYFYAQTGVTFTVNLEEYSGKPMVYISAAKVTLTPSTSSYQFFANSSLTSVSITPNATECFAIAVRASVPSSFGLQILSSVSSAVPSAPEQRTCGSVLSGRYDAPTVFEEYNSSVWLPNKFARTISDVEVVYFNAKKGVPFTVGISEFSGRPLLYIARTVLSIYPGNDDGTDYYANVTDSSSGSSIVVTPTASECYAIAVRTRVPTTFGLQILSSDSSTAPSAPKQRTCGSLLSARFDAPNVIEEYNSSVSLPRATVDLGNNKLVYYNAKKDVPFAVDFLEFTGIPILYVARTVLSIYPDSTGFDYIANVSSLGAGRAVVVTPTATECYAIEVRSQTASAFSLALVENAALPTVPATTAAPAPSSEEPATTSAPSSEAPATSTPAATTDAPSTGSPSESKSNGRNKKLGLVLGVIFGIAVLITIGVAAYRNKRSRKNEEGIPLTQSPSSFV